MNDQSVTSSDPSPPGDGHYILYAATCTGLRRWSGKLGFEVRHLGLSADPLRRLRQLS